MKNVKLYGLLIAGLFAIMSCDNGDDDVLNFAPVADAGPNQSITLPASTATLTGTGTDSDGEIRAYLWSQVSGPSASVINNPGNATTSVKFYDAGTYIFQLMVTDNSGATSVDTTRIVVSPAVQQTLTLQPANNPLDMGIVTRDGVDASGPSNPDLPLMTWTNSGALVHFRSLYKFDLSQIPQNATVVSATLYLYSYPSPTPNGNFVDANFGANNSFIIQRVTTDWSAGTITAFNFSTTTQNQVIVPHTTASSLDLALDVKGLVAGMVNNAANYGFFMKLQNEVTYTSRIFVSSKNNVYPTKRPKLVVVYQ
jgi:hypothetical protein